MAMQYNQRCIRISGRKKTDWAAEAIGKLSD
jgi:hypothetical protein